MARKYFGKVIIEPLNGGSGKIVKRFETQDDYINFRNAHCRFFGDLQPDLADFYKHFAVGNSILNFTFNLTGG